jgi:phosphoribosylanthranilate isomerase
MTRVKICGITREEDAGLAVALGASAVGFVFWPGSPRFVTPAGAHDIVRTLPPLVAAVGVFVDQPPGEIEAIARAVPLDAIQLHGNESPDMCLRFGRRAIKAVTVEGLAGWSRSPESITLLVDASDRVRRGGTGKQVDWGAVAPVARSRRVILAGGLDPGNVVEAVTTVRPFAIDLSSGVESAPGVKDPSRMIALFEALRRAEVEWR